MYSIFNSKGECTSYYAYLGDWSFDKFFKACQSTKALPIKGVHPSRNASDEECFVAYLKRDFADYLADFAIKYSYRNLEEVFKCYCRETCFSDWYKDTFDQRPHLDSSFYLYAMGYKEVGGIRFCMSPFSEEVEDAVASAEAYRAYLLGKTE